MCPFARKDLSSHVTLEPDFVIHKMLGSDGEGGLVGWER